MKEANTPKELLEMITNSKPNTTIKYKEKMTIGGSTGGKSQLHKRLDKHGFETYARRHCVNIKWEENITIDETHAMKFYPDNGIQYQIEVKQNGETHIHIPDCVNEKTEIELLQKATKQLTKLIK